MSLSSLHVRGLSRLQREARKFYIVAWGLEVTLSHDEPLEERVSNWGRPT